MFKIKSNTKGMAQLEWVLTTLVMIAVIAGTLQLFQTRMQAVHTNAAGQIPLTVNLTN